MGLKRSRMANALALSICLWSLLFFFTEYSTYSASVQTVGAGQDQPRDLVQSHDNTNFPLVGRHRTVECGECHIDGVIQGTPQTCETCHWVRRQDDRYRLQLGSQCENCHTPQSWKQIVGGPWDHELMTGFRLVGAHRAVECAQCHGERGFAGISTQCSACHLTDYQNTQQPDHVAAGFPAECESCHTSSVDWRGAVIFEHDFFPLRGQHQTAGCDDCHSNGQFAGLSSDCSTCHIDDYNRTTSPSHQQAGFPTDCDSCHSRGANTWQGATLDHDSHFPLRGQHQALDCEACHGNGVYAGTPKDCSACHMEDYNSTTDPNHQQAGFPLDCESCHGSSASGWSGANFAHNRFRLNGSHRSAECTDCHSNGQFRGISSDCVSCHIDDYNRTNHQAQGFPTDCENCHGNSATNWSGANFDHSQFFRLQGAHRSLDCNACHRNGYNLPRDCFGCHAQDYQAARNPDHAASGFPSNCEQCHLPNHTSWSQAVFNHRFPLTGPHNRDCTECHTSGNLRQFSCTVCHEQGETDRDHDEESGYVYNSQACYSCHPDGRE